VTPQELPGLSSYEMIQSNLNESLVAYKIAVEKLGLYPSDKKKMLAMPFYMAKRAEDPVPRRGQFAFTLFKELTGEDWYDDAFIKHDLETKITEFEYEKFLNPAMLKGVDTTTPEFKEMVRTLNYLS